MGASLLYYECDKEEVGEEVDETVYELPKRGKGKLLTIDRDIFCERCGMFGKVIHLCIFYFICSVESI